MFSAYSNLVREAKKLCTDAVPGPWLVNNRNFSLISQDKLQINARKPARHLKIATFWQTTELAVLGNDDNPTLRLICTAPDIIPELVAAIEDLDAQLERAYTELGIIATQGRRKTQATKQTKQGWLI